MLTEQWTPLRYHIIQSQLWRTKKRIVAVWAGRGSGKTELAKRRVVRMLPVRKYWRRPMYFYALPTRPQAKRVAWEDIKALVPPRWLDGEPNETEMRIDTVFGSSLYCVGMDRPQRIEGNQWDGGVFDECFVAGTPVDMKAGRKRIEDIVVGDRVQCARGLGQVIAVKSRDKREIVVVKSKDYELVCSANHPFFTQRGWVVAKNLRIGDYHVRTAAVQNLSETALRSKREPYTDVLQRTLQGARSRAEELIVAKSERTYRSRRRHTTRAGDQSKFCIAGRAIRLERQDQRNEDIKRRYVLTARRQGQRNDSATTIVAGRAGQRLHSRVCCVDRIAKRLRFADVVWTRHCARAQYARRRDRRNKSYEQVHARRAQRQYFEGVRLESVEIYKSGSAEFAKRSGGRDTVTLYDLTVDLHPSFSVYGYLVHNSSDQRPGAFAKSIMPALSHRNGWCWRIGVPKRTGRGAAEFRAFCEFAASGKDSETGAYTWPSSDILTPDQLRWARENNDPKDYAEQYEASWEDIGGLVFYAFDERLHVDNEVTYDHSQPLLVSCDFNVDPMAWVICQKTEFSAALLVIDELYMRNSHTQLALDALFMRYAKHNAGFEFFGDATSRARKTSAPSTTDYLLIKGDKRFRARTWFPKANPSRRTRFAETNAMFRNAEGVQRIRIHPRCRNLIADLKQRSYVEGTNEPDDHNDIGHITDALGYVIHRLFPIKLAGLNSAGKVYLGKI